jgi:hypothetical protein
MHREREEFEERGQSEKIVMLRYRHHMNKVRE